MYKKDPDTHMEEMHYVTSTENYQKKTKISLKRKRKNTKRYLSWIWIECLVGNESFERGRLGWFKKNLFTYCDLS